MYSRVLMVPITLLTIVAIWFWHKHINPQLLLTLQLYPVLINLIIFCIFTASLFHPPSIIERIARLREPNLPAHAILYTRRVTQVWCIFLFINAVIALITALWTSPAVWAIYNGGISYLLMGLLFIGEYLVRLYLKRRWQTNA